MFSWYDEIQKIKRWIDEHAEENVSLTMISENSRYSTFYLSKKFHEIEGISLKKYLLSIKIQHAAFQLNENNKKIIDIAFDHGYSSHEAFSRAFFKIYGISPWSYRKISKPTSNTEKSRLLQAVGYTKPIGGTKMKTYVKQMMDYNFYAFYAEDVDEKYWHFFKDGLWWQMGNNFIKSYDNVIDFEYCAENFTKYGEIFINQQVKETPAPWEKALDLFIAEMSKIDADWYIHGSAAMALWGIDVKPKDVNIIVPNYSDFEKVRKLLAKFAIIPIERCEDWLMSGGGTIFMEASIGVYFNNKEFEPYDMSKHPKIRHNGAEVYVSTLESLKNDNENYNRPQRVKLIEEKMKNL